jgi:type IV secretory pathway VirB4 component
VDEERRATFEDSGNHFESGYHLTLVYLPPEESRARAAGMLYENRPTEGVDWRERLTAFVGGDGSRLRPARWRDAGNRVAG